MLYPYKSRHILSLIITTGLLSIPFNQALAQVPDSLQRLLSAQSLPQSAIGIWVQRAGETTPLARLNDEQMLNPASTIKLATTLASLNALGPDYTWKTEFYSHAPIVNGVLKGDLIMRGTGDPGLVSEEHWRMIGSLYRTGLRKIEGDLILDSSYFSLAPEDPGAFDGQPLRAYNQPPHAMLVNANSLRFHVLPDAEGRIHIEADPPLPGMKINNQLQAGSGNCGDWQRGIHYQASGNEVTFSGRYPVHCGNYELLRTAVDPEFYAAEMFRLHWRQWGGEFNGHVRTVPSPPLPARALLQHQSRPLGDLVKVANKWSHNIMTRHMALTLGAERYGTPATLEKARNALYETLRESGVEVGGMVIDNGSGLSRHVRISPRQLGQVLNAGWNSPWRHEFISSMSISGVDGTTRRQFTASPEAGRMHLKTGRLNNVSAIAGYVRSECGKDLMVVLMINHADAHAGAGSQLQERFLRWAHNLDCQ